MEVNTLYAKPFLKWAGGKSQLIEQIIQYLPDEIGTGQINKYVEPFVGGGALFFHIAQSYDIEELMITDINKELILSYKTIKEDVISLIEVLKDMQIKYHKLSENKQKEYYYLVRSEFNEQRIDIDYAKFNQSWVDRTAQIIFLNRTCFNGLFRVNSKGEFNVPFGRYMNPMICNEDNIKAVSEILQHTKIRFGDFTVCKDFVDKLTFVYFDPPYRPISKTSNFTSYSNFEFDDSAQLRLASFYRLLDKMGAKLMLSNSDPKNENPDDNFFDDTYRDFNIARVKANRMINCVAEKRGAINEILILNYEK